MRTITTTLVVMSRFDFNTSLIANISSTTPANHSRVGSINTFSSWSVRLLTMPTQPGRRQRLVLLGELARITRPSRHKFKKRRDRRALSRGDPSGSKACDGRRYLSRGGAVADGLWQSEIDHQRSAVQNLDMASEPKLEFCDGCRAQNSGRSRCGNVVFETSSGSQSRRPGIVSSCTYDPDHQFAACPNSIDTI